MDTLEDAIGELKTRILILNERIWEDRVRETKIDAWLSNFDGRVTDPQIERLHALYWLSQFMYFGGREIRVLLRSLYRDLFFCPLVQKIQQENPGIDITKLETLIREELRYTRFVGVGNPSESGVHLLYYFRQENNLAKNQFLDAVQIFSRQASPSPTIWNFFKTFIPFKNRSETKIRNPSIRRYIFLDDICGSGETAITYSNEVLRNLFSLKPEVEVAYYCLFATESGIQNVKRTLFGENSAAVYELDESYRCLDTDSRYLKSVPKFIDPELARSIAIVYGEYLNPTFAKGYKDSQMLMGFHHNTPDNTLGIMWCDMSCGGLKPWNPIFKRYPKIYGGEI